MKIRGQRDISAHYLHGSGVLEEQRQVPEELGRREAVSPVGEGARFVAPSRPSRSLGTRDPIAEQGDLEGRVYRGNKVESRV